MPDMPRKRKPYVHREVTRHGTVAWYFRRGTGKRVRLRGGYESPQWLADYDAAMGIGRRSEAAPHPEGGTVGWLIDRYLDSLAFHSFRPGTQKQRRAILANVRKTAGAGKLSTLTGRDIAAGRDRRAATPAAAATYLKVVRAMFKWAVEAQLIESNPADGVKAKIPRSDGHHTWTLDEVRTFQAHFPLGTRQRLAMDILLFTGMRRQDAVLLGRQHVRKGFIHYRAAKNAAEITLPLLEPLRRSIEATQTGDLTFLVTEKGRAFSEASFGNWFREACIAAGVPGRAHGLRKAGATFAAEAGASEKQLMALFGWSDPKMAQHYTRKANNAMLAQAAAEGILSGEAGSKQGRNGNIYPRTVGSGAGDKPKNLDKTDR